MKADLTAAARRERVLRYASYGLMVLSPFLLLGVLSLILGRSALDSWPVWTDELDYWRSLQNWNAVGFATGYSGLSEIVPEAGTLSVSPSRDRAQSCTAYSLRRKRAAARQPSSTISQRPCIAAR